PTLPYKSIRRAALQADRPVCGQAVRCRAAAALPAIRKGTQHAGPAARNTQPALAPEARRRYTPLSSRRDPRLCFPAPVPGRRLPAHRGRPAAGDGAAPADLGTPERANPGKRGTAETVTHCPHLHASVRRTTV